MVCSLVCESPERGGMPAHQVRQLVEDVNHRDLVTVAGEATATNNATRQCTDVQDATSWQE
jgi:hypothetical protein